MYLLIIRYRVLWLSLNTDFHGSEFGFVNTGDPNAETNTFWSCLWPKNRKLSLKTLVNMKLNCILVISFPLSRKSYLDPEDLVWGFLPLLKQLRMVRLDVWVLGPTLPLPCPWVGYLPMKYRGWADVLMVISASQSLRLCIVGLWLSILRVTGSLWKRVFPMRVSISWRRHYTQANVACWSLGITKSLLRKC